MSHLSSDHSRGMSRREAFRFGCESEETAWRDWGTPSRNLWRWWWQGGGALELLSLSFGEPLLRQNSGLGFDRNRDPE